jgi:hypothetical protein
MKNIKLHISPHPAESAVACPEVWDAEGDSRDLAGRCSSNLSHQNLRRPAGGRRPAAGRRINSLNSINMQYKFNKHTY